MELAGVVATAVYAGMWGLVHSLLASDPAKGLARRLFGPRADRWYRLAYNAFSLATLLPIGLILSRYPDHLLYSVHGPWYLVVMSVRAAFGAGLIYALFTTGISDLSGLRQAGWIPGSRAESEPVLVTTGLYSWVRHPVYLFSIGFVWLEPGMTLHLLTLYSVLTIYVFIATFFEERRLAQQFGASYLEYQARVPRLLPLPFRHR